LKLLRPISKPIPASPKPILSSPPLLQPKPNGRGSNPPKCSKENPPSKAFKEKRKKAKTKSRKSLTSLPKSQKFSKNTPITLIAESISTLQ
jgi:hypothetical protein